MPQIEIESLSKEYTIEDSKITAVESVSMTVEKGEFISIIGHSGSGKTTLLSIIGGILKPSAGSVTVDGTDIYKLDEAGLSKYRAERIGYMFQFASLLPVLTAKENLLLPTLFSSISAPEAEKDAIEYLGLVGLADKVNAFPSQLSGGQQRRVAIARALMNRPELILADEPTGDLDEETEAEVIALFNKINKERGITFILVTHSTELAGTAKRRLRMTRGKLEVI